MMNFKFEIYIFSEHINTFRWINAILLGLKFSKFIIQAWKNCENGNFSGVNRSKLISRKIEGKTKFLVFHTVLPPSFANPLEAFEAVTTFSQRLVDLNSY